MDAFDALLFILNKCATRLNSFNKTCYFSSAACGGPHGDRHSQCSLLSVLLVGAWLLWWAGSVPGLLCDPLPSVALLDADVVPLQEAICCRSSVETVTMHSSEGSEAAAAHELFMRDSDFMAGAWAVECTASESRNVPISRCRAGTHSARFSVVETMH